MGADTGTVVAIILALVGAGGVFGGIAVWRKVPAEKASIIVTAAQGALVVQAGVLETLQEELDRAHRRIAELNEELHVEIKRLREERTLLRAENSRLRAEVRRLERRVDELESSTDAAGA